MEPISIVSKTSSKDSFRKFGKIKSNLGEHVIPEDIILQDLCPSIRLILLLGIFPKDKNSKDSCYFRFMSRTIQNIIHAFWLYVFIIGSLVVIPLMRQLQTNFTLSLMNMIIAIIHFILHLKRYKVYPTVRAIEKFYFSVTTEGYQPMRKRLLVLVFCCLLAVFAMALFSFEHLRVAGVMDGYSKDFIFDMNTTKKECAFFQIFSSLFVTSTVMYHHLTPIATCIFICSIYLAFKKTISKFKERIRADRLQKNTNFDCYIFLYNRMLDVLSEVEDLLSACTFFLYGCLVTNQLCVVTQIIANGGMLTHPASVLMESLLTVKNTAIFFSLTLIGSSVTQEMNNVAREIKCLSIESTHDFEKLSLLLQNVSNSSASLTAWQMFTLKRSLILTMTSVLTSYGMLLVQFSNQNK
ncbi:hypothetical protein HNY73_016328 [Argiope bruennichi]|uniref:Gustatory receptor n=1 Tax=Argiope bruennichi TaxID=94029 RepID=A0A8T0EI42_ARGBR|nr:hypothetical protein HNY73_016328 [Argiope bruennichi]